jgi:Ca2+-binding EF-hand superfamily protein
MNNRLSAFVLLSIVGATAFASLRAAAEETAAAEPTAAAPAEALPANDPTDVQDLVLLHIGRPIVIRLHIRLAGQGYQATWGDCLWERFQELDVDANGTLDNDEFQRGDWSTFAERRTKAGTVRGEPITFLDLDTNPQDDVISFTELVEQLAQCCFGLNRAIQRRATAAGDPLFALLDHDRDGQLDAQEMTAGIETLYRFDRDEDETFSQFELRSDGNPFADAVYENPNQAQASGELMLAPIPDQTAEAVCQAIMARYDRPAQGEPQADHRLSREELRLADDQFVTADTNGDGGIDAAELQTWYESRPPDVEISVVLDSGVPNGKRLQITSSAGASEPGLLQTAVADNGSLVIRGTAFELDVRASGSGEPKRVVESARQLFKRGDGDKNDYLDKNELRRVRGGAEFSRIDKDHDGKIFVEEYVEYVTRQNEMASQRTSAVFSDRGSTLFEIMDANRNGQLATRELRTLPQVVSSWDGDHDGKIKHDDIPRRYQLQFAPGSGTAGTNGVVTLAVATSGPNNPRLSGVGPEWFQRMDRNRDGDLSRREFLGTRAEFLRLDADHDGLLDAKEAEAVSTAK